MFDQASLRPIDPAGATLPFPDDHLEVHVPSLCLLAVDLLLTHVLIPVFSLELLQSPSLPEVALECVAFATFLVILGSQGMVVPHLVGPLVADSAALQVEAGLASLQDCCSRVGAIKKKGFGRNSDLLLKNF